MNKTKSYAQSGQDLLALTFFHLYPATNKVFLDVGAFDGISFSNSRLFFDNGWSGVCIEPVLKNYKRLEILYENSNVITAHAAASDYEGELIMNVATIPGAEDWGSDVSSPSDNVLERWPDYIWEKEVVMATTINKILETNNVAHVNFVSIDVEGHEMSVLHGFDLQKYNPFLLVVEYSSTKERNELTDYLKHQGYASWVDNGQDIFFVKSPILRNWKVLIYGYYQQLKFSKPAQYITGMVKQLTP